MAGLLARFKPQGIEVPASHVVAYFVRQYRKENESLLLFMSNPDEWKQKCQFAPGSASATVVRLNQVWETDATPGDVMLTDGRHTVIGIIDVWSRRVKVLVTPTSKAQAIATLARRCIIDWGVPEVLRSDNGKDFTARHMTRVLDALEIYQDLCPPFTPEAKPHIERFFRTFSHGLVELLPGFIGHNVAERKAIEARKSFAERMMKRGEIVEVKLSAREFQDICNRWIEAVYHRNPHSGMDGKTPVQMAEESTDQVRRIADERALDVLLCPAPKDGGFRTVVKKGIEVDHRYYFNTALAGYARKRLRALVDHTDLGCIYCFEESGAFVCMATCPDWYGISAEDAAGALKRRQKAILAAKRKELKALVKQAKIEMVPEDVLSYRESLIDNAATPKESISYTTPAIEEAIAAADKRDGIINKDALAGPLPVPPEVEAYEEQQQKVVDLQEKRRERRDFENNLEIYYWILDQIKAGAATPAQKQWKREYEDWQDNGMRRPFASAIGIAALTGQLDETVEGL
jgi:transposase InsO family protein